MKQERDNILSFDQGAGFYLRTGRRQAEAGNLVRALAHLRTAHEKDREDAQITIALAEGRLEELPPDGLFGLASNFIALEEFGPARICLEYYLHAAPEGVYAADAEDYLDLMDDEPEMDWQLGLD